MGHLSVSMPHQCFQVAGMPGHGRMALEAQELTQPEGGKNDERKAAWGPETPEGPVLSLLLPSDEAQPPSSLDS